MTYAILQDGKKKKLVQVQSVDGKTATVVVADETMAFEKTRQELTVSKKELICYLGDNPAMGRAYGVKIMPYHDKSKLANWGTVLWFCKPTNSFTVHLQRATEKVWKKLEAAKLTRDFPIRLMITPPDKTYAGHYKVNSRGKLDLLSIHPNEEWETQTWYEIICHEIGHQLIERRFEAKHRQRWARLYHSNVTVSKTTPKQLAKLLKDFVAAQTTVKGFSKALEESEQTLFNAVLGYIEQCHFLSPKFLQHALADSFDSIRDYWPDNPMDLSDMQVVLTEYANKNADEFFCEALRMHWSKQELPPPIQKEVARTLEEIA